MSALCIEPRQLPWLLLVVQEPIAPTAAAAAIADAKNGSPLDLGVHGVVGQKCWKGMHMSCTCMWLWTMGVGGDRLEKRPKAVAQASTQARPMNGSCTCTCMEQLLIETRPENCREEVSTM